MSKYVKVAVFSQADFVSLASKPADRGLAEHAFRFLCTYLDRVAPDKPDLIVLPEQADRPHFPTTEERNAYYEERGDGVLRLLGDYARAHSSFIAYNAARRAEDGNLYNCTTLVDRKGTPIYRYDKNFPVVGEMTGNHITPGAHASVVDCELGRVGAAICFDMNFEELRHEYAALKPQMVLFSSNYHAGMARNFFAYDTRSYLIASIGGGLPGGIVNPLGVDICTTSSYERHAVATINLDYAVCHLDENRGKRLDALKRAYGPKVKIEVPSYLGPALITSECEEKSAMDFVREFEIELLDDYLARSRAVRAEHLK